MNTFDDYSNPYKYKQALLRVYKKIFSGVIKESFLISMHNIIEHDPRYTSIVFGYLNPESIISVESAVCGKNYTTINICKMIVMTHYINAICLSEFERGRLQNDSAYKSRLADDVMKMLAVEKLATANLSNSSIEGYLPLIYYVSSLNNYCGNKYEELFGLNAPMNPLYDFNFNQRMFYKIITKIKACVGLADIGAVDELAVVYRTLIELFMKYALIWDQNELVIKAFSEFENASFNYSNRLNVPNNYLTEASKMKVSKAQYLNYGWITKIKEFNEIKNNNNKRFSLDGLAALLDKKYKYISHSFGTDLRNMYSGRNPQAHASSLMMNYLDLELNIFQNIAVMLKLICEIMSQKLFKFDFKVGNLDLIDLLNDALNDSRKVYEWLKTDQSNLDKTNIDYRNRAICSLKMKS